MPASTCRPQIFVCATRVARLEPNGVPDPGAGNLYVSDALVSIEFDPEIREGQEIEIPNGCGGTCATYKARDEWKWLNLSLTLCTPDPRLGEILTAGSSDVLTQGEAVGMAYPPLNTAIAELGVSVEVWAQRITSGGSLDADFPYAWWVFPKVHLAPAASTFENDAFNPVYEGIAVENENWHDGPLNDWTETSDRVAQWMPTTTIPTASCNYAEIAAT